MKKPLTLQAAFYWTGRHWDWLAKTGNNRKHIYPPLKKENVRSNCFLCEYFKEGLRAENKRIRGECKSCVSYMKVFGCVHCEFTSNSLYFKWSNADSTEDRKKYAGDIAAEARRNWREIREGSDG